LGFLVAFITCAGAVSAALAVYYLSSGNHNILLDTEGARQFAVQSDHAGREICCSCLLPLANKGEQQGMVNNVFCQPVYGGKIMNDLEIRAHLRLAAEEKGENSYWKSVILKKNDCLTTELKLVVRSRVDLSALLGALPRVKVLIYYQVVGRKGIEWKLAEITMPLERKQKKVVE